MDSLRMESVPIRRGPGYRRLEIKEWEVEVGDWAVKVRFGLPRPGDPVKVGFHLGASAPIFGA